MAITELRAADNASLGALATELGTTLYELRLLANAGSPAVVTATVDKSQASSALAAIRRHGHRAVMLDRGEVTPSAAMTALRDFRLDASGVVASASAADVLHYGDLLVLLRAMHRTSSQRTDEVKERKLRPGMAIATGGLVMTKTTKREVTTTTTEQQQVLYLFRRSGTAPWILRERDARYAGLGAELRPTSLENFTTTIRKIRALAPGVAYDERLLHTRPIRGVADGVEAVDLLAYLIAADVAYSGAF